MDIFKVLQEELDVSRSQIEATVKLIDEGNTIPFIARYRKEVTGSLNDEVLRTLDERLRYLRNLEERQEQVIATIREQEKLTPELEQQILEAKTLVAVEDLYRPYRPKRRTRATIAKEKGLEPLADLLCAQQAAGPLEEIAAAYVDEEKGVESAAAAIQGAKDILAERISDDARYRTYIRKITMEEGTIRSEAKDEQAKTVYEMYYHYEEPVAKAAGHRILALNRGEAEKVLTVKIVAPKERILQYLEKQVILSDDPHTAPVLRETVEDSYDRLIGPAIEREIRNELTERAEEGAVKVFGKNLEQLLMQPPIAGQVVLGWDPAFRTGCKLAVVDPTGKVLDTVVIYPTAPQNKVKEAKATLKKLIERYGITLISVGNGTASRESEQVIVELLKEIPQKVQYVIVNEAGASVYSASKLATEEFPEFDVGQRSAASIARRLQDPLAELVKIEPKAIGVGQYQHDMDQKHLNETLSGVVEDCVNKVGVDLNTASASLLGYISGISKALAKNIVAYREANGAFTDRRQLLKVAKLGPKAFEQCAGFLRILKGDDPLDYTGVHPESYEAARKLLARMGMTSDDILKGPSSMHISDYGALAQELGVGEPTLRDIVKELSSPGRDPRDEMPRPILRTDVMELKDLKPGMVLKGTVRNVIDFGAFVDIGVHQDGLVHISEMTDRFIKHPLEVVSVGDIVEVKVLGVELEKQRISLTMKLKETAKKEGRDKGGSSPAGGGRKEERTSDGSGRGRRRSQERGAGRADHPGQERGAGRADRSGRQENAGNGKGRGRESGDTAREKRRAGGVSIPNSGIFAGIKL
ncbi:MAG: S1 RNA-binding domain-containing protein [Lachnospiraceae bacterium]|nr:S1 RNA-binding domain-containing protein [Lachnospiraceae bacterium]